MRIAVATLLSAALLAAGTGLHPVPWLTWLAPLPVLFMAARSGARTAFAAGSLAWLGGQTLMWHYFAGVLEMPLPVAASIILGTSALFGLAVLLFRALRARPWLAAPAFAAGWVAVEYGVSLALPHGAWWSLAYTQSDVLPVLQTLSLTGVWGVTFLLLLVPAAIATLDLRAVLPTALIGALALGYGFARLAVPSDAPGERVALLTTDRQDGSLDVTGAEGRAILAGYVERVRDLAASGARLIVLPEKTFSVDDTTLPLVAEPMTKIATEHGVDVVVGLTLARNGARYNTALDFPPTGKPVEYVKQHLIPGGEGELRPGPAGNTAYVPGRAWAIAVCKDLDFPGLVRSYRDGGATALFAPAWDFPGDEWIHSRIALARGVENGMTIARVPRDGLLLLSDPTGRVVAEKASRGAPFVSVTAALPAAAAPTLYSRLGDWFAWACLGLTLCSGASLLAGSIPGRRTRAAARTATA